MTWPTARSNGCHGTTWIPWPVWSRQRSLQGEDAEEGARGRGGGLTWERARGHAAELNFRGQKGKLRTFADASRFTYQITSPTPLLWREEQDDTLQPSKEHRLRRMTEEVALSRFWDHDRPNDEGIQEMFRIKDWLRDTDEGRSSREAILEEMARILPESYRVADFLVEPAVEEAR